MKKNPRNGIYYLDWLNKWTKDILDANAKKDKLVNESGLNEKIKTLATKEDKNISNRNNIKSRTRQNCETLNVDLSYFLAKKISGDDGFHNMFSYQPGIY